MTFSTKSPEANWSGSTELLAHNKRLREENASLLAEVERLKEWQKTAVQTLLAAGIETGRLMLENAKLRAEVKS